MLSVMEKAGDPVQDFLTSGRTGRRNALPNILSQHAATTTADLSRCLQKLSTAERDPRAPSTSGVAQQAAAVASTSSVNANGGGSPEGASAGTANLGADVSQPGSDVTGVHS